jgi:DNA/RNA endonuclease YhcR with UshA esterase domain
MKITIAIIGLAMLCGCSRSVPSAEAERHVGEHCTVEGYVASFRGSGHGTVTLYFDNAHPKETFTAVSSHGEIPADDLKQFEQHTVRVTGTVEEYKGKPEIVLHSLEQISLVK